MTASDAGEGIVAYFFTDNVSLTPGPDNVTWLTDNSSMTVTFDNGTNESKTVYGYAKDEAGQISSAANASIVFDNSTPVINSAADNGSGVVISTSGFKSGIVGLVLSAYDNDTSDNFSSGFKDFFVTFGVDNSSGSTKIAPATPSSSDWVSIDNISGLTSSTKAFSSANHPYSFSHSGTETIMNTDNFTVYVYFRDNASNVSSAAAIRNITKTYQ